MKEFDRSLLESGELLVKSGSGIIANLSKIVALITAILAVLVTFTDITFASLAAEEVTSVLLLLLIASYVIYFSLEDAGERRGEGSEEYKLAYERHSALKNRVTPDMIPALREFLREYSKAEAAHRQSCELMRLGYTEEEYAAYLRGECTDKKAKRALGRIAKIRPTPISTSTLLSKERLRGRSELYDPERGKHLRLGARLIPTALCMVVTVSVVLSAKSDLGAEEICEGLMKLSTLPIVGIRGYLAGLSYAKETRTGWLETKARLLECFLGIPKD